MSRFFEDGTPATVFRLMHRTTKDVELRCPICDDNYVHWSPPRIEDSGERGYEAGWGGKGDLLVIPFWAECGSSWELCIGFHKGMSYAAIRMGESCRIDYHKYIKSPEWRAKADIAKQRAGYRCQLCNSEGPLDAHHRTYERLGNEIPDDITVLCRDCHAKFHDKDGEQS